MSRKKNKRYTPQGTVLKKLQEIAAYLKKMPFIECLNLLSQHIRLREDLMFLHSGLWIKQIKLTNMSNTTFTAIHICMFWSIFATTVEQTVHTFKPITLITENLLKKADNYYKFIIVHHCTPQTQQVYPSYIQAFFVLR